MLLDKTALLAEFELKTEEVELKTGTVIVSELNGTDYLDLYTDPQYQIDGVMDLKKLRPAMIARCVVDQDGNRVFSDEEASVVAKSASKPFLKLMEAVNRVNADSGDEIKNSEETVSDSLCTGSVSTSDIEAQDTWPAASPPEI
jgi:hypothetical protein